MAKAVLGSLRVGDGESVAVMGVINLSRDSFFRGSVTDPSEVVNRAARMVSDGAGMIDLGAMATGPSSKPVAPEAEKRALIPAVRAVVRALDAPVSVDTQRAEVAAEAVSAGASVVNDVTGLKGDPEMAEVLRATGASAILMASRRAPGDVYGMREIRECLKKSLEICRAHGIPMRRIVIDPGIGHWPGRLARIGHLRPRPGGYTPATDHDLRILARLRELEALRRPICVGISRKSFIGEVLGGRKPEERLAGSLAATVIAILNGARLIRTHDVRETADAARIAEAIIGA